jgi:heme-degrading monooxygenase HmoA
MFAQTPQPPYYAVIFTSARTDGDNGYAEMADRMVELAGQPDGLLGVGSARNEVGITVSYWRDLESIQKWKENSEHVIAREKGREEWYNSFHLRITKVKSDYLFRK